MRTRVNICFDQGQKLLVMMTQPYFVFWCSSRQVRLDLVVEEAQDAPNRHGDALLASGAVALIGWGYQKLAVASCHRPVAGAALWVRMALRHCDVNLDPIETLASSVWRVLVRNKKKCLISKFLRCTYRFYSIVRSTKSNCAVRAYYL